MRDVHSIRLPFQRSDHHAANEEPLQEPYDLERRILNNATSGNYNDVARDVQTVNLQNIKNKEVSAMSLRLLLKCLSGSVVRLIAQLNTENGDWQSKCLEKIEMIRNEHIFEHGFDAILEVYRDI